MRAAFKFSFLVLWVLLMVAVCFVPWVLHLEAARRWLVMLTFRVAARIMGLQLTQSGEPEARRPLLVVSNHCSYADILAIGASMPVSFTPKSDIKRWPLINICCYVAGCVFVERKASALTKVRAQIASKLRMGRAICLFAEGTTGHGDRIKPFKSGFFSLSEGLEDLWVQPLTLAYTARNGQPIDNEQRATVAWVDDTKLVPHVWRFLSYRSVSVHLHFHPAVAARNYETRKALCQHCEQVVGDALIKTLTHQKERHVVS